MTITMEDGKIKTVVERAARTEASSTSSESKKRKRETSQQPEVLGKHGRRPARTAIAAGDESSTSDEERERRWMEAQKVQQNRREGKFPTAGIKTAKKSEKRTSFKPSANDLTSSAHKMNISPDKHPSTIVQNDPVLDNPLTENQMLAAAGGQAAELGSAQPKVACPDILARRYQCPTKVGAAKTVSQCVELFCAARNPRYAMEEFDCPLLEPFGRLTQAYVGDMASLSEGPFDLTRGRRPKAVIDYGLGGGMEWDDVVRDLDQEGFFKSIEDWATVSFDTEGYPQRSDKKYSADAIKDQISVLHLMAPNGVLLQIAINHDGTEQGDPNERGVPDTIRQIFAAETVMKMGFGATEDAEKLMRTEVIKEIRSVCDLHNLALIAFPQFDKEIEHIAVGKRFVAEQLGSPVVFVDTKSRGAPPSHQLTGYRNRKWDFTARFDHWSDDMVWYNRYDHCLGWVLLHSCAARFAYVEKYQGDLFRVEMFLLCKIRNWRPRLQALDLSNETVRPHTDWFGKDTEQRPDPDNPDRMLTYEIKARTFYHEEKPLFNSTEEIFSRMQQLNHPWLSDRGGMKMERFDKIDELIEQIAPERNITAIIDNYYAGDDLGVHAPHACSRCGSSHHRTKFCDVRDGDLHCIYCKTTHNIKVCPMLHSKCSSCGLRGHAPYNHGVSLVKLFNTFLKGRWVGFFTCRLVHGPYAYRRKRTNNDIVKMEYIINTEV